MFTYVLVQTEIFGKFLTYSYGTRGLLKGIFDILDFIVIVLTPLGVFHPRVKLKFDQMFVYLFM